MGALTHRAVQTILDSLKECSIEETFKVVTREAVKTGLSERHLKEIVEAIVYEEKNPK